MFCKFIQCVICLGLLAMLAIAVYPTASEIAVVMGVHIILGYALFFNQIAACLILLVGYLALMLAVTELLERFERRYGKPFCDMMDSKIESFLKKGQA